MNKEKIYNGNLNIGKKTISIDTNFDFRNILIHSVGKIKIRTINKDLNIKHINNKILIMNLKNKKITDLFDYKGIALFNKCVLTTMQRSKYNLYINRHSLEMWNTLSKTIKAGTNTELTQSWDLLTRYWEDLDFNGNNDKKPYIYYKIIYDQETKTETTTREIRKK